VTSDDGITIESIEREFPGWEPYKGTDRRWHAQLSDAKPHVVVHDDDLLGLRDEIIRENSQRYERAWARRTAL
jgi:hypothetical protein